MPITIFPRKRKMQIRSTAHTLAKIGERFAQIVMITALGIASSTAAVQPGHLRVASFISPLSPQNAEVMTPWIEQLESSSDGELVLDFFPGGTLGRHGNFQLKLLRDGVQDVSLIVPGYTPGLFPDNDLFELPMLMDNTLEATITYYRMITGGHLRGYDDTKLISVFMSQPYFIHLNSPYEKFGDLRGKKIRVAGYLQAEIVRRLGATPIGGIAVTQIRESISRGLVDGTILGWDSMHIFGVKYVTNYHIEVPVTYTPILLLMNLDSYQALPDHLQELIDKYSGELMSRDFSSATSALGTKTYLEMKAEANHYFITPDDVDILEWRGALSALEDEWISRNPEGISRMRTFRQILTEVRFELNREKTQ